MKRASVLIISVLIILIGTSVHAQDARVNYSLSVSIEGTATVTSNPAGINCSDNTGTCSYSFPPGTVVALLAMVPPADEFGSYFFSEWSGDASGTVAAAAVVMNGSKSVIAKTVALGPPLAAWYFIDPTDTVYYHPVAEPLVSGSMESSKPISIGTKPGSVTLSLGTAVFTDPVDIYIGISIDGWNDMLLFGPGNTYALLSDGLLAYKQNWTSAVDETLISDLALPGGTYRLFMKVVDSSDSDTFFTWQTYFVSTPILMLDPFALP